MTSEHETHIHISEEPEEKKPNIFLRILLIVGILIILFFISIWIVRFIPKALSSLASVNLTSVFKGQDDLAIELDKKEVKNGDSFKISWKNNTKDLSGTYTLSYKCIPELTLSYESTRGTRPVVCESTFPLPDNTNQYTFKVNNRNSEDLELPINITFWDKDSEKLKLQNNTSIKILKNIDANAEDKEANNGDTQNNNNVNLIDLTEDNAPSTQIERTSSTKPDLEIKLIKAGIYVGKTIQSTNIVKPSDKIGITFLVSNRGQNPSGTWRLKTSLPTTVTSDRNYISKNQPSINKGDSYEMTLAFDSFDKNIKNAVISIESSTDGNLDNNKIEIPFELDKNIPSGKADLKVRIIDSGIMDRVSNKFFSVNSISKDDKGAIKFEIENAGGEETGAFNFEINVPVKGDRTIKSGIQRSMKAGEKRTFTLGFDALESGNQIISIKVDSDNRIDESDEGNNSSEENLYINP